MGKGRKTYLVKISGRVVSLWLWDVQFRFLHAVDTLVNVLRKACGNTAVLNNILKQKFPSTSYEWCSFLFSATVNTAKLKNILFTFLNNRWIFRMLIKREIVNDERFSLMKSRNVMTSPESIGDQEAEQLLPRMLMSCAAQAFSCRKEKCIFSFCCMLLYIYPQKCIMQKKLFHQ